MKKIDIPFLRNASPLCKYWWDRAVVMFLAKGCHDPPVNGYQGPVLWPTGSFICKGFFGLAIPWPAGPQLGFRWISSIAHWRSSCPIAPWPGFPGPIPPVPKLPSPVQVTPEVKGIPLLGSLGVWLGIWPPSEKNN